jgi:hypothetical protein
MGSFCKFFGFSRLKQPSAELYLLAYVESPGGVAAGCSINLQQPPARESI